MKNQPLIPYYKRLEYKQMAERWNIEKSINYDYVESGDNISLNDLPTGNIRNKAFESAYDYITRIDAAREHKWAVITPIISAVGAILVTIYFMYFVMNMRIL